MTRYTRTDPSPRFREMEKMYREMHAEGDVHNNIPAERTFHGISLQPHIPLIGRLIAAHGARSLLDYGAGKGEGYANARQQMPDGTVRHGLKEIWGLDSVTLYDPGYTPFSAYPSGRFDIVVCTDVLEHVPEEDIPWLFEELFGFAGKMLFCSIACYPAKKILPNGENAHITQKPPSWWVDRIEEAAAAQPKVRFTAVIDTADGFRRTYQG